MAATVINQITNTSTASQVIQPTPKPGEVLIGKDPTGREVWAKPVSPEQAQATAQITQQISSGQIGAIISSTGEILATYKPGTSPPMREVMEHLNKPQNQPNITQQNQIIDTSKIVLGPSVPVSQPKPSMVPPGTTTQSVNVPVPEYRQIGYTTYNVSATEVRSEYGTIQKPDAGKLFDVEAIGKGAPSGSIVEKTPTGATIRVPEWAALPPGVFESPGTSIYVKTEGGRTIEKGVMPTQDLLQPQASKMFLEEPFIRFSADPNAIISGKVVSIGHALFSDQSIDLIASQIKAEPASPQGFVLRPSFSAASVPVGKDIARRYVQEAYIANLPYEQRQGAAIQLWQQNIMTSATQSAPGIFITSYFGGAVLGKAFSVAPSIIGRTATTAASYTFAATTTALLAQNVWGTMTSTALKPEQKVAELAVVAGAVYTGYKGFKEGPNIQSPIAYGKVMSQGGDVIYRGVYLQKGYATLPLVGESGGKLIIGMPSPERIALAAGDLPRLQGNLGREIGIQALKTRYPDYVIEWKQDLFSLSSPLISQKSAFIAKTLEFEKVGFAPKQAKILTDYLAYESKYAIRGSAGESPQLAEHLKGENIFGKIGDVDIQVGAGKAETGKLVKGLFEKYKAAGYDVKITTPEENFLATGRRTSTTILNLGTPARPLSKGGMALSFKPVGAEEYVYLGGKGAEIGEGIMRQPLIDIQGVKVQALGEQLGYRYLLTSTPQKESFAPLPSRSPQKGKLDVPRLPVDIESQLLSREASVSQAINPLYRAQTTYLRALQMKIFGGPPGTIPLYESDSTGLIGRTASGTYDYYPVESYYRGRVSSSPGALAGSSGGTATSSPGALSLISKFTAPQSRIVVPSQPSYGSAPSGYESPLSPIGYIQPPITPPQRSVPSRYTGTQYTFIPLPTKEQGYLYGGSYGERKQKRQLPVGRIAWKQGAVFKVWYAPFGQKNVKTTRRPIEGVQYFKGFGSASRSAVKRGGVVPEKASRTMGIVRITARTPKEKPSLTFMSRGRQTGKKKEKSWLGL